MDSNKSFVIMIVLSIVLIGFMWIFNPKEKTQPQVINKTLEKTKNIIEEKKTNIPNFGTFELVQKKQTEKYDLTYENSNIKISFDPNDAVIKHAWIKYTFLEKEADNSSDLVQPLTAFDGALRLKFGSWENENTISNLTDGNNFYNYKRENDVFTFTCAIKKKNEPLVYNITKKYSFLNDSNLFKLDIEISNNKNAALNIDSSDAAFSLGWGPLLGLESRAKKEVSKNQISNFIYLSGKDIIKVNHNKDSITVNKPGFFANKTVKGLYGNITKETDDSWVAADNHYFASLIYPDKQNYKYFFDFRDFANKNYYTGLSRYTPNSHITSTFYVYIGPKIKSILKKYDNVQKDNFNLTGSNISKLEPKIMYGLGNLIGDLLEIVYHAVKNYGIAIILLTLLIKVLLSPLTHKSMIAQQKMSKLQPKIKDLQTKYKNNPQELQKQTMELYRREKINPFGGCLPMLLQLPILFAMYNLLNNMVQLKGASFLWIHDLSIPDSIYNFNFTIPMLNISSLNILPFIMTIVQILSSLMTQEGQSNKQANIMIWSMTIFMFVIFYNTSAGLVLYWTVMNMLNLVQQLYIIALKKKKEVNV